MTNTRPFFFLLSFCLLTRSGARSHALCVFLTRPHSPLTSPCRRRSSALVIPHPSQRPPQAGLTLCLPVLGGFVVVPPPVPRRRLVVRQRSAALVTPPGATSFSTTSSSSRFDSLSACLGWSRCCPPLPPLPVHQVRRRRHRTSLESGVWTSHPSRGGACSFIYTHTASG